MAHHTAGKFTILDIRTGPFVGNPAFMLLDSTQALAFAEGLVEKGLRPRVDFAVVEWVQPSIVKDGVIPTAAALIHERVETLWREWKAKQPKPKKYVVELWAGVDQGGSFPPVYCRFGWLTVKRALTDSETGISLSREGATVFDAVTRAQTDAWYNDLGSPPHIQLVPREVE